LTKTLEVTLTLHPFRLVTVQMHDTEWFMTLLQVAGTCASGPSRNAFRADEQLSYLHLCQNNFYRAC